MALNKLQDKAYKAVIKGKEQVVVLTGAGGTGKTYTVQHIIPKYKGDITITATTNRAKDVLATSCYVKAYTVQRARGFSLVKSGYNNILRKVKKAMPTNLLIVDEVSMLPKKVYKDIMEEVANNPQFQVLFLGDPIQLPAIGAGVDIEDIPGLHIELTEQKRQSDPAESYTRYMSELRDAIREGGSAPSFNGVEGITLHTSHLEFCRAYNADTGSKKLTAYRNSVVDKYNSNIHKGENLINIGDEVVIDKPIWVNEQVIANNGDTVFVTGVEPGEYDGSSLVIVVTVDGTIGKVLFWVNKSAKQAVLDELQAEGQQDEYWRIADASVGLKHLYACTVHKTQGSTYDTIYIDGTDLWSAHTALPNRYSQPISYEMFLRLQYVAISRMTTHCHIFVGKVRNYANMREN